MRDRNSKKGVQSRILKIVGKGPGLGLGRKKKERKTLDIDLGTWETEQRCVSLWSLMCCIPIR